MQAVDRLIHDSLHTGVPLVAEVSQHLIAAGGKRLRPALLLLTAGALGYAGTGHHRLAAVVEFIHTATLLHDDVVDESSLRRGLPTANARFGNPASVLVGDFLYTRAFQMMVQAQDMRVMQILADATNTIAEGEVMQLLHLGNAAVDEADYLRVIRAKTAKLFEGSARLGAVLAGSDAPREEQCARYGQALGTAFQIIDDVMDYTAASDVMGKSVGDDLAEGKTTLPLIHAIRTANDEQRQLLTRAIMERNGLDYLEQIQEILQQTGAFDYSRNKAEDEIKKAKLALSILPDTPYRQALMSLADLAVNRSS